MRARLKWRILTGGSQAGTQSGEERRQYDGFKYHCTKLGQEGFDEGLDSSLAGRGRGLAVGGYMTTISDDETSMI